MTVHPQFVVDESGERRGVILPIEEYRELMESLQDVIDASLIDDAKNDPLVAWGAVKTNRSRRRHRVL